MYLYGLGEIFLGFVIVVGGTVLSVFLGIALLALANKLRNKYSQHYNLITWLGVIALGLYVCFVFSVFFYFSGSNRADSVKEALSIALLLPYV